MVSTPFGRRPRISTTAYTGRAVAPAQPDPVTTGLINKNSLQLAVVSSQIQSMTAQMNSLAGSLQVIANSLATTQAIERQKEAQEQALQAKLAEQKLREGKESAIEKKIQSATIEPAQRLASKAQFTLGSLGQFFARLLGGWLLVKGVETLKALSEGNGEKLNEIKNTVLKNLALITGVFVGYKGGIRLLSLAFSRMGGRLLAVGAAGLFVKPFRDFINFIVEAAKGVVKQIPGLSNLLPEDPSPDETQPPTAGSPEVSSSNSSSSSSTSTSSSSSTSTSSSSNTSNTSGSTTPAKTEGSPSSPQTTLMGNNKSNQNQSSENKTTVNNNTNVNISPQNGSTAKVEPTENMMGQKPNEGSGNEKAEFDPTIPAERGETSLQTETTKGSTEETTSAQIEGAPKGQTSGEMSTDNKALLTMGFSTDEVQQLIETERSIGRTGTLPVQDMISPTKRGDVASKVGPAPEPPVNVVPIPTNQGSSAPPQEQQVASGGINNAPSFATSNSDNIYILGALSNFNVVMA